MGNIRFNGDLFHNGEILYAEELNVMLKRLYADQALTLDPVPSILIDQASLNNVEDYWVAYINTSSSPSILYFADYSTATSAGFPYKDNVVGICMKKEDENAVLVIALRDANTLPSEKHLHKPITFSSSMKTSKGEYNSSCQRVEEGEGSWEIKYSETWNGDFGERNTEKVNKAMEVEGGFEALTSCRNYNPLPWEMNMRGVWCLPTVEDMERIVEGGTVLDEKIKGVGGGEMGLNRVSYYTCGERDEERCWIWNTGNGEEDNPDIDNNDNPGFRTVLKNTIGATVVGVRAILKIYKQS